MDISVIVPLYHGRKYFISIINMLQKALQNFEAEIIFVNDYPEERFDDLFERCCASVSIRLLQNDRNYGIHESRVRGLKAAKGEYILFLDQDDKIDVSYFEKQMEKIKGYDACFCNGIFRKDEIIYSIVRPNFTREALLREKNCIISPGQVLLRKDSIPVQWSENIVQNSGTDDYYLWLLMAINQRKIIYNDVVLYRHVDNGNNASCNFMGMSQSIIEVGKLIEKELTDEKEKKVWNLCVKRYCQRFKVLNDTELILRKTEKIKDFMRKENIKNIAIYGYGQVGQILYLKLQNAGINIAEVIDRRGGRTESGQIIRKLEESELMEDLIITTTIIDDSDIKKCLRLYNKRVITIEEMKEMLG